MTGIPVDFVDLASALPAVELDPRYACADNFTGAVVPGYETGKLLLTSAAVSALAAALREAQTAGLTFRIYDAYRPQRAVEHFLRWADEADDGELKRRYYPNIPKGELFKRGLLVRESSHTRGSTVDLTLVDADGAALDMGTPFDFFDAASAPDSPLPTPQQRANRLLLQRLMRDNGFEPLATEWWHFTLRDEPYPETYFDFVVR